MGHRQLYLYFCFRNTPNLLAVQRDILPLALANTVKRDAIINDAYSEVIRAGADGYMGIQFVDEDVEMCGRSGKTTTSRDQNPREYIIDVRDYETTCRIICEWLSTMKFEWNSGRWNRNIPRIGFAKDAEDEYKRRGSMKRRWNPLRNTAHVYSRLRQVKDTFPHQKRT
ncbi:hypothetical protein BDN70DRAFT_896943 [Pholiota conissans]|uniref:Uncharacterized protein n=1 Tax=Pholiota conissans TaxID=109636 RepID=A0A9P5YXE7_9AGAR|nr:hypothetical protein BDN70DRAFT_896943 [Pholiota conissans]